MAKKLITDRERFFSHIKKTKSGCWEWQLTLDRDGYGRFKIGSYTDDSRRQAIASRWAYQEFVGKIPSGLQIDHLCRNRACVNPDHLDVVTYLENAQRGNEHTKLYCINGHPLFGNNLYLYSKPNGMRGRACRACVKISQKKFIANNPDAQQIAQAKFAAKNREKLRLAQAARRANWTKERWEYERQRDRIYAAKKRAEKRRRAK